MFHKLMYLILSIKSKGEEGIQFQFLSNHKFPLPNKLIY